MKLHKTVTAARVQQLIECYGTSYSAWPADEREAAIAILNKSPELQQARQEEARLDTILKQNATTQTYDIHALSRQITAHLPAQKQTDRPGLFAYLVSLASLPILVPTAAALLLAIGVILLQPGSPVATDTLFELWAWQDITGQSVATDHDAADADFMDLVELETTDA